MTLNIINHPPEMIFNVENGKQIFFKLEFIIQID